MNLISVQFFLFVAVTAAIYFLCSGRKYQWCVLLGVSYFYYIFTCNRYVIYLLVTTITTYAGARGIDHLAAVSTQTVKAHKGEWDKETKKAYKNQMQSKKRWLMIAVLVLNFGILSVLKYTGFVEESLNSALNALGIGFRLPLPKLVLPLGISFYTFQSMGYLIDVYRGKFPAEKNFGKVALFVSFFPQIVQGPIAFYSDLAHQLYENHRFSYEKCKSGVLLIFWGAFQKMVVADRAVHMIDLVTANDRGFHGTYILMAALMYALQLYADFAGGINVCRGVAELFGITMAENFRRPYFSKTLTEYWHRWHITLGEWVRTYLFYPMSISKRFLKMGKDLKSHGMRHLGRVLPTSIASLLTFLVIGIWHGAAWKYVAFGLWNGGVIMVSAIAEPWTTALVQKLHIRKEAAWYQVFAMVRTFLLVLVGYYFDIAQGFKAAMRMMWHSVTDLHLADFKNFSCLADSGLVRSDYLVIIAGALVILVVSILQERSGRQLRDVLEQKSLWIQWSVYLLLIFAVLIFGAYGPGSNPADFVYMQF